MLQKTYIIFAVGIISLFTGVVYTVVNSTNTMIEGQTSVFDARMNNQIDGVEYARRTRENENAYRTSVAKALEKIESKFIQVSRVVKKMNGLGGDKLSDEPSFQMVDQEVNITVLNDSYVVYLNGTPYPIDSLKLNVTDNDTVVMKVIVVQQNNYYEYYPYIPGNMSELLNVSGDYNYSADLDAIAGNLTEGIERFRTERVS